MMVISERYMREVAPFYDPLLVKECTGDWPAAEYDCFEWWDGFHTSAVNTHSSWNGHGWAFKRRCKAISWMIEQYHEKRP